MAGSGTHVQTGLRRIRGLLDERHPAQAFEAASALADDLPVNRDILYRVAVSQRLLGRPDDAPAILERLEHAHPRFGRLFRPRSTAERAVALNPAPTASWKTLAVLWRHAGDCERTGAAARQALQLQSVPGPVVAASGMLAEDDLARRGARVAALPAAAWQPSRGHAAGCPG